MPVTARLSRRFYDTFGEELTNELVDWFNSVDATYRADLREMNEANFLRFDAKLGERLAELRGDWRTELAHLDAKVTGMGETLRKELAVTKADLIKWMFAFWAPTALAVVALLLRK